MIARACELVTEYSVRLCELHAAPLHDQSSAARVPATCAQSVSQGSSRLGSAGRRLVGTSTRRTASPKRGRMAGMTQRGSARIPRFRTG